MNVLTRRNVFRFWRVPDAQATGLSELIRKLYLTYFGREPDPTGWAMWTNVMRQMRLAIAVNGFVPSGEFEGLRPDVANRTAVAALVTRFYNEILGSRPRPGRPQCLGGQSCVDQELRRAGRRIPHVDGVRGPAPDVP